MNKMAEISIYVKSSSPEQDNNIQTLYVVCMYWAVEIVFKWWACMHLDLMYGKVKFLSLYLLNGTSLNSRLHIMKI